MKGSLLWVGVLEVWHWKSGRTDGTLPPPGDGLIPSSRGWRSKIKGGDPPLGTFRFWTITWYRCSHGEFRSKLFDLGLSDHPWCACSQVPQTPEHILRECPLLLDARQDMYVGMTRSFEVGRHLSNADLVCNERRFSFFRGFVRVWVSRWDILRVPISWFCSFLFYFNFTLS